MKNLISFITLLIFVHTIIYYMISAEAQERLPDAVLDEDGNELHNDNVYYVSPRTQPGGGSGIIQYPLSGEICTYDVIQLLYGVGNPLAFSQNGSLLGGVILEHIDLNITFAKSVGCGSTDVWRRGDYDEVIGQYFVTIGGNINGNSDDEKTLGDAFQIRKAEDDYYKFVFCPRTCISCHEECDDVGTFSVGGMKKLAVSGDSAPFYIKFRRVKPELASY